jgi:hypothetical protein
MGLGRKLNSLRGHPGDEGDTVEMKRLAPRRP